MAVVLCLGALAQDPQDRYGVYEKIEKIDEMPGREIDKSYGYEKSLKREKEKNPDLYEA